MLDETGLITEKSVATVLLGSEIYSGLFTCDQGKYGDFIVYCRQNSGISFLNLNPHTLKGAYTSMSGNVLFGDSVRIRV